MNGTPLPFKAPSDTPIVGQPFTLLAVMIPVTATLRCNCGGNDTIQIINSAAGTCPSCRKVYMLAFNPTTGQIQVQIGTAEQEPIQ